MTSPYSDHPDRTPSGNNFNYRRGFLFKKTNSQPWRGKTAIVCGGTQGLGLAIAEELVHQRVGHLIILARDSEKLEREVERLVSLAENPVSALQHDKLAERTITRVTSIAADLTNADSVRAAAQHLRTITDAVDLVVQAVGCSDRGTIMDLSLTRLHELVDVNLGSSLHAIQQFSPFLVSKGGVFVLIGSLSSLFAPRYLGGYSIVKHGLVALAQQSRLELADQGIHVTLCCPGPIQRIDAGQRYAGSMMQGLPPEAGLPGGGAKIEGLCPRLLSQELLRSAWQRDILLIRPRKAWWLYLLSTLMPQWGEQILVRKSS